VINASWDTKSKSNGLADSVGLMVYEGTQVYLQSAARVRIHDILVWIRIWIRRSMPLTNEKPDPDSGFGSGYCSFRH
jgi:hypothetical protein